jgi:DNA-binding NtrC family response regulator
VCTTLEQAGYRPQPAASGAEALEAFCAPAGEPFRLVLSDVIMPSMGGVELARRLRRLDPNVNLLFMSGQVSAELTGENIGNWNFHLLQKPFRAEGLLHAVRTALDRGSGRPADSAAAATGEVRV